LDFFHHQQTIFPEVVKLSKIKIKKKIEKKIPICKIQDLRSKTINDDWRLMNEMILENDKFYKNLEE
jgi:hypothetical protein